MKIPERNKREVITEDPFLEFQVWREEKKENGIFSKNAPRCFLLGMASGGMSPPHLCSTNRNSAVENRNYGAGNRMKCQAENQSALHESLHLCLRAPLPTVSINTNSLSNTGGGCITIRLQRAPWRHTA